LSQPSFIFGKRNKIVLVSMRSNLIIHAKHKSVEILI
jgi:hypothetical protein